MKSKQQGIILNSTSFVGQFAIAMVNLALVYHLKLNFGFSAQMVGLAAALYTSTYFIFCLLLGPLAQRMRPRHSVELSTLGMSVCIATLVFSHNITLVLVALGLYGMFMSFLWPQVESWIARGKEGKDLSKAMSSFNVSWSFGTALSPLVTGILVEYSPLTPLVVGMVLFIAVFLLIAISTYVNPHLQAVVSEKQHIKNTALVDQSTSLRYISWAGVLTVYAALAVILTIFPLYALEHLPLRESEVGTLLLVRGITTALLFLYLGKTQWWHFKKNLIIGTLIATSALCLWATTGSSFAHYVLFFLLFGIVFAFAYSFSIFHGASGSINRSKRMLIHEVLLTIGTVSGNVMGGVVYQNINFTSVLFVCSALVLLPVLALGFVKEKSPANMPAN